MTRRTALRTASRSPSVGLLIAAIALVAGGLAVWWGLWQGGPKMTPEQAAAACADIVTSFQRDHKIEPRTTPFEVIPTVRDDKVHVSGVVGDQATHRALMAAIRAGIGRAAVVDELRELPDPRLAPRNRAIVNVPVLNLGDSPNHADGKHMVTQAVLGNVLELLEETQGWYRVRMHDQYLGWVDGRNIVLVDAAEAQRFMAGRQAVVTAKTAPIRAAAAANAPNLLPKDAVQGTVLPLGEQKDGWVCVRLPDGRAGWLTANSVRIADSLAAAFPPGDAASIIAVARQYVGLPYLWGGTTAYGFDCSGLTQFAYRMNGYSLPRDADMQYAAGAVVPDRSALKPGDLVFFSTFKPGPSHVGIYIGDGLYIHSGSGGVAINSFDPRAPEYSKDLDQKYLGARRFIK